MSTTGDIEVLLKVLGDSSGAQQSVKELQSKLEMMQRSLATTQQSLAAAADEASRTRFQAIAENQQRIVDETKAQLASLGEAETQAAQAGASSFRTAVRSEMGDLLTLRRAMMASFGLVSFGYIISEWGRVADSVKSAALAVGGFGETAQKAFQADIKASDDALVHFQGMTTQIKIATGQMLISGTLQAQAAVEAQLKLVKTNLENATAIAGPILAKAFDLKDTIALNRLQGEASMLNQRLIAQLKEMGELEKQQHSEKTKAADASARAAERAEREAEREAKAWQEFETKMGGIYGHLEEMNRGWEKETARTTQRVLEQNQRIQDEINRQAIHVDRGGSQAWMTEQGRDSLENFNRVMREQMSILQMEPAALAAIAREYPKITMAQMRALPGIQQITQAWKDQGSTMDRTLSDSLNRLQAFENMFPNLSQKWDAAFASMKGPTDAFKVSMAAMGSEMWQLGAAVTQAGVHALIYGQNVGKAMEQAAKAVLASIAEQSAVQAAFSLATYFIDLATFNYAGAAEALTAAEMFGIVAGVAGGAAAAIPGGGSTKSRSSYGGGAGSSSRRGEGYGSESGGGGDGSGSGQQLAPGGNLPAAPKNANLTISIMGEQEAGTWLANTLNTAITQGGAQLQATHTTAIPNPIA